MKVLTIGCGIVGFAAIHASLEVKEHLGNAFIIESLGYYVLVLVSASGRILAANSTKSSC